MSRGALQGLLGCALLVAGAGVRSASAADGARFDLTGPKVQVRVTRAGMTLPIAAVPDLEDGDRLWVQADLPPSQSVRYLMVVAFLRGTTNPPPDSWFVRIETWDKKVREEGSEIPVPEGAEQAVMFLAPVTGGDFGTLRSAVQGRPGIFVRAVHDLDLAGFEQARIEKYIASMKQVPEAQLSDAKALQEHSNLIAGTLALKPNGDCVKLPPDQQYTCLTQSGSQSLLDDGHGQSLVSALSNGAGSDFINQASYTGLAGAGQYSAYVGAVVDLVRLMGSLHTAQYQYIPAIAFPEDDSLNLRLNTAPSFHNPKSVIVIGLPSIQPTSAPPLRPTHPDLTSCLLQPDLVLPVEGAPLVFSTGFAHDLVLHINYPEAAAAGPERPQDLPLTPDAYKGGLVVGSQGERRSLTNWNPSAAGSAEPQADAGAKSGNEPAESPARAHPAATGSAGLSGTIEGFWGFDRFTGPTMPLEDAPGKGWKVISHDPLIAGKKAEVLVSSTGAACVESIRLDKAPAGEKLSWKPADQPNTIEVGLNVSAGTTQDPQTVHLSIQQFGAAKPDSVSLVSYSAPAKLNALIYHAEDRAAHLSGSSLDQVKSVRLGGVDFVPGPEVQKPAVSTAGAPAAGSDSITLQVPAGGKLPALGAGQSTTADVTLKDGRVLPITVVVAESRPFVRLISKADVAASRAPDGSGLAIHLGSQDELPLSDGILFSLKSEQPFPRTGSVEVASVDGSLRTTLSLEKANLILQDPKTVLATVEPLKSFGPSAFGPIQVRAVAPDGSTGDWIPLTTLVRLPKLTGLNCPAGPDSPAAAAVTGDGAGPSAPAEATGKATPQGTAENSAVGSVSANGGAAPAGAAGAGAGAAGGGSGAAGSGSGVAGGGSGVAGGGNPMSCTLTGADLFLVDAVSADAGFSAPVQVPEGFVENSLAVPAPVNGVLYLRLRDDPAVVDSVAVPAPAQPDAPSPEHKRAKR